MGRSLLVIMLCLKAPAVPRAQEVTVRFDHGIVTLVAREATVREILAAWARVGGTDLLNLDGLPADERLSLRLERVPELHALDVVMRGAGGFVVTRRASPNPRSSTFARVLLAPLRSTAALPALHSGEAPPPATPPYSGPEDDAPPFDPVPADPFAEPD